MLALHDLEARPGSERPLLLLLHGLGERTAAVTRAGPIVAGTGVGPRLHRARRVDRSRRRWLHRGDADGRRRRRAGRPRPLDRARAGSRGLRRAAPSPAPGRPTCGAPRWRRPGLSAAAVRPPTSGFIAGAPGEQPGPVPIPARSSSWRATCAHRTTPPPSPVRLPSSPASNGRSRCARCPALRGSRPWHPSRAYSRRGFPRRSATTPDRRDRSPRRGPGCSAGPSGRARSPRRRRPPWRGTDRAGSIATNTGVTARISQCVRSARRHSAKKTRRPEARPGGSCRFERPPNARPASGSRSFHRFTCSLVSYQPPPRSNGRNRRTGPSAVGRPQPGRPVHHPAPALHIVHASVSRTTTHGHGRWTIMPPRR